MRHDFPDRYSTRNSPLHRLDPRTKIIISLSLLVLVSAVGSPVQLAAQALAALLLVSISRVPLDFYWKKLRTVTPIAVLLAFLPWMSRLPGRPAAEAWRESWPEASLLAPKILLSVLILSLLISCTAFKDLLWGLRRFRLPQIAATLSRLLYSYLFIFIDELHRMQRAYRCRTPVRRVSAFSLYGHLAAGVFLRSLNRSDSVFKAMVSRGFDGNFPEEAPHAFASRDLFALFLCLLFIILTQSAQLS